MADFIFIFIFIQGLVSYQAVSFFFFLPFISNPQNTNSKAIEILITRKFWHQIRIDSGK